ncbi:MAG: hypothetical protein Q8R26_03790 [bacterium]|nr:hypothetical protein [bacterium]
MINQELKDYIEKSLKHGVSQSDIKAALKTQGWPEDIINASFPKIQENFSAPVPKLATDSMVIASISPYAVILSVGLLTTLLILGSQVFEDIMKINSVATRLIVEAVVVVPLLTIIFSINAALKDGGERFKILIHPFAITMVWLFSRLFVQLFLYIYNANAAIGVYIGLGFVIVFLTGIVIFAQRKFNKHQ